MFVSLLSILAFSKCPIAQPTELEACGDAYYSSSKVRLSNYHANLPFLTKAKYTCYDGDFLCPVLNGEATLRCGRDCYLPKMYS